MNTGFVRQKILRDEDEGRSIRVEGDTVFNQSFDLIWLTFVNQ